MSRAGPTLIVFLGGTGDSPVERLVAGARLAATFDSIETALGTDAYAGAVLVTDSAPGGPGVSGLDIDVDSGPFHFGRRLAGVIRARSLASVVYMGGGSAPLLTADDFAGVGRAVGSGKTVTNNQYSADLVGFPAAGAGTMAAVESVQRDNALAQALADASSGLAVEELPRSIATLFDIDAPADLAVLALAGLGGPRLRAYLTSIAIDTKPYEELLPLFLDRRKQIIVSGRVGSHAWRYLETQTACRVRLFAEERGMEADGRAEAGAARSLLGFHLEAVGLPRFFEALAELGDAALIDSRVLAAHAGVHPSREDRFLSDLGRWKEIGDPFLRDLTRGAAEAPLPVILGGHSLMSGALMLLNEHAWTLRDEGLLV
jgi:hypothetical protein